MHNGNFNAEALSFKGQVAHVLSTQRKAMPSNNVSSDNAIEKIGRLNGRMMGRLSKRWYYLMSH